MKPDFQEFEERVIFFHGLPVVSLYELGSGAVWLPVDAVAPAFGYANGDALFSRNNWLDYLHEYRRNWGRPATRRINIPHSGRTEKIFYYSQQPQGDLLIVAQSFLEQPEIIALWQKPPLPCRPAAPPTTLDEFETFFALEQWSEEGFAHILAICFVNYGVPNQRTASRNLLTYFAYDARTPREWTKRLDGLIDWAVSRGLTEVHLSDLARFENTDPPVPFVDVAIRR